MINLAIKEAFGVFREQPYCIGAVITDKRGRVLSTGHNRYDKTHPRQRYWSSRSEKYRDRNGRDFLHAELSAIIQNKTRREHTIYVARVRNQDGEPAMAKPCESCMIAIKYETNIQKVVYTDHDGKISEFWVDRE